MIRQKIISDEFKKMFCSMKSVEHCDYLMLSDCSNTCGYAKSVYGVGAMDMQTASRLRNNIEIIAGGSYE